MQFPLGLGRRAEVFLETNIPMLWSAGVKECWRTDGKERSLRFEFFHDSMTPRRSYASREDLG